MSEQRRPENRPRMGGMRPGGGGGPIQFVEKPKDFKGTLKKFTRYLSPYKWKIALVVLFAAASTVFTIVGPKILGRATDELFTGITGILRGDPNAMNFHAIGLILLTALGLYCISAAFSYFQGFLISGVSANVAYDLRDSLEKKINHLPLNYFHTTSQGDVLSRVTNDVDLLSTNLNNSITQAVSSVTSFIGILIMMITINFSMTLIALAILPVSILGILFVAKTSQKYFRSQQQHLGALNGHTEEMYSGHLVIKAFSGEKKSVERFIETNDKLYTTSWKANFISALIFPITVIVGNIGYVLICIIGASMAPERISLGDIQAFITYMRSFVQPIQQMANISNQIQQTIAAAERVFEFLDEKEEAAENPKVHILQLDAQEATGAVQIKGDVKFDHIRFGYYTDEVVIKDFSTDIKVGQKVAIVGPTGAGKTTLVKLLMRFYDLDHGTITIDGYDINDFGRQDIRREFGMVLQDAWLSNTTIMENIRYGDPKASDEEVIQAAKAAQVDRFVHVLPEGYNTVINEETTNISQGQKQLITIARAILSNAKILILDEATSSVDTRTEILIQKAMDNLMENRTSFIIAHRLSTIRNADIILCIDNGDIVEQGTHDELIAMNGYYSKLYRSQFEDVSA